MTLNNSLYFYSQYYDGLPTGLCDNVRDLHNRLDAPGSDKDTENRATARNKLITDQKYQASGTEIPLCEQSFQLVTEYPGLLIGTGYPHDLAVIGAVKMGCHFDYATGLPTIPGSTVKGLLRSYMKDYWELVKDDLGPMPENFIDHFFVESKAVFLDAWPIQPEESGRLFGLESITPHTVPKEYGDSRSDYEGLTEPTPLQGLKVLPGVTYVFRFLLPDSVDGISRASLLKAFAELLVMLGAGAKTNVSFGAFNPTDDPVSETILEAVA